MIRHYKDRSDGYYALAEGVSPNAGWLEISESEAEAFRIANSTAPKVPFRVPIRKARKALRAAGLLPAIEAALAAISGPAGDDARDDWQYSSEVQRDNATLLLLSASLGLTEQQVDQLFITADKLP